MKAWWSDLVALTEEQQGLMTAAQARQIGVSRMELSRMVDREVLDRVQHGVYSLAGSGGDQWQWLSAAWLATAPTRRAGERLADPVPDVVISHASAAHLLDLGDRDADRHEFTSSTRRQTRNPDVTFHQGVIAEDEWMVHRGLPVTTPLATVAALGRAGIDGDHLGQMVRDCIVQWDCTVGELAAVLDRASHGYGYDSGAELVEIMVAKAEMPHALRDYYQMWQVLPHHQLPASGPAGLAVSEQMKNLATTPALAAISGKVGAMQQNLAIFETVNQFARHNPALAAMPWLPASAAGLGVKNLKLTQALTPTLAILQGRHFDRQPPTDGH